MPHVDPRLNRHLRDANSEMLIDAIFIILEPHQNPLEIWEDNGFAKQIIQQIIQETNEEPSFLRFISRANAVALTAHPKFINTLLTHSCVKVASSATIDPFHF
ncbi:hypothetical protein Q5691_22730 [Microcoleus sp. w1-18aA5]|uniref:hypothetical protein n=1 Tax=Microcoleus sp. w1-18aA5 TaxID=2818982 RepID=UPI002FD2D79C